MKYILVLLIIFSCKSEQPRPINNYLDYEEDPQIYEVQEKVNE